MLPVIFREYTSETGRWFVSDRGFPAAVESTPVRKVSPSTTPGLLPFYARGVDPS